MGNGEELPIKQLEKKKKTQKYVYIIIGQTVEKCDSEKWKQIR